MNFNPTKCECLHITRSRTPKVFTYNLMGTDLKTVNQCRYLGIHITNTLTWNSHIDKITNDANRMLGVVKRNLARCDPPVKRIAYLALVRPKLEYASTVWDPHQSNHIHKLEMVQRRAARFIKSDYQRTSTSSVTASLSPKASDWVCRTLSDIFFPCSYPSLKTVYTLAWWSPLARI